ncbi:MAG TPA: hypothetical protein VMT54_19460 [Candidatus Cybelea sp.]|nr:hypothetical protein [Candidatus Cybelea sp.]
MHRALLAILIVAALTPRTARAQDQDHYSLLMVWMPGLCKLEPDRPECKDLSLKRYDGRNLAFLAIAAARSSGFANTYCFTFPSDSEMDRERRWCDMDKPHVGDAIADALKELMPVAQSCEDRGLWARYASCTLYSPDEYYSRGIRLATALSGTQVNTQIAAAAGTTASQSALVKAFATDFGDDWSNAIDFVCRKIAGKSHLYEVKISVTARALSRGLAKEFLWKPTAALRRSCPESFLVDAPPGMVLEGGGTAPSTAAPTSEAPTQAPPAAPAPAPAEPPPPSSAPVGPVETAPLEPVTR